METLLAKKVKELRMSIEEFASKAGITLDQANRALNGTYYPHHANRMQILRALGLDTLIGSDEDPEHKEAIAILNDMRLHRNKKYYGKEKKEMRKRGRKITYKTFFNTLKEEKGYSIYDVQKMLKDELGESISINNIYDYLSGRKLPPIRIMYAFCDIFEVGTEEGIDHFATDHQNFVQDLKTLKEGKKSGYSTRKKNEEIQMANDIFIEGLRDRLIKMVDEAVFDEIDVNERCDRLKDLYYQINCTLYILHKFKTKGNTPKIKENTLYEE